MLKLTLQPQGQDYSDRRSEQGQIRAEEESGEIHAYVYYGKSVDLRRKDLHTCQN